MGKIPVIVDWRSMTPDTRLALVNAIYLKANWAQEFDPDNTKAGDHLLDGKTVTIPDDAPVGRPEPRFRLGPRLEGDRAVPKGPAGAPLAMTLILPAISAPERRRCPRPR